MIIELMLMLIVVGAGIVFVAWSNTRRRKQDALERREVEDSTTKLKVELERTANEIIGRMENHVTHLENILDESERNRNQLEGRVTELKKLLKKSEAQAGEIKDLMARLEDAGAEVDGMQRKMEKLERRLNIVMATPLPVQQPVTIPQPSLINSMPIMNAPIPPINKPITQPVPPAQVQSSVKMTPPPSPPPMPPISRTPPAPKVEPPPEVKPPDKVFDKILEETIAESPKSDEKPQQRDSIVLLPETKQPAKVIEADPVKIETTRKKLTQASAEMAAKSSEETSDAEPLQKDAKKKRTKRAKRDVRKAAIEAIKEVEKQNELESKAATKKVTPSEKPKPPDKKEQIPERRDLKLETTDSAIVKEMLLAGMSLDDISRETGLGKSAIELIQEMTRRQLERK